MSATQQAWFPISRLTKFPDFLPPANEVCEGYVFTGVCHSVHKGGGGACVVAGGVRGCSGGRGGMRGFFDEIRSMSGRYASYWNAFLSSIFFHFYRPQTRFGEGNVFPPVCQSFSSQWPPKRAVRILLKCILVSVFFFFFKFCFF